MEWIVSKFENRYLDQLDDLPPKEWQSNAYDLFTYNDWQPWFHPYQVVDGQKLAGFGMLFHFDDLAWLGWIVVDKKYRGKGIGTSITNHLLSEGKKLGAGRFILTATELGYPIYEKIGFSTTSHYYFLTPPANYKTIYNRSKIRTATYSDLDAIVDMDVQATGENRKELLESHLENTFVYTDETATGFFIESLGDGFVVAQNADAGENLMNFRIKKQKNKVVIPEGNKAIIEDLKEKGFTVTAKVPRMVMGKESNWRPQMIYNRGSGYCG